MPPEETAGGAELAASTSTLLLEPPARERELEAENADLKHELKIVSTKKAELEDQIIDLRAQLIERRQAEQDLQQQLKTLSEFAINNGAHQKTVDLQRMYQQLLHKDERIVELNNVILEKERTIMDLQERCREEAQVAHAKSLAVQIEFDSRKFADASTETDAHFPQSKKAAGGAVKRENSPGRAVPQLRVNGNGNGSPPPADPSEDQSSYTTETAAYADELDAEREWSASPSTSKQLRKHRKRVTFDLNARKSALAADLSKVKQEAAESADVEAQSLAQAVVDLSTENDQLRRTIAEMERALAASQEGHKIAELEEEAEQARKEGKNQALKARAAAQARIKELEMKLLELKVSSSKEIENLKAATEVLKSSREWSLMENSRLLEQIQMGKTKLDDLRGELDSSLEATTYFRQKLEAEQRRTENLNIELRAAQRRVQQFGEEREFLQSEIGRLKEAISAQDEFVSLLEGDLIVYEAHVGILRESLGASKKEDRQMIRSKAFAAKLNALEMEKQQIAKRNNDERLRTKALNVKIRQLEQERDELSLRLSQYEGNAAHDVGESLISTDDELMNDTKPTFDEQAALMVESTVSEPIFPSGSHFHADPELGGQLQLELTSAVDLPPQLSSQSTLRSAAPVDTNADQTVEELERAHEQRTEAVAILNHFMQTICEHLYAHGQSTLADQMERDLRTYQQAPDLELVVVVNQVRRFVDQVIESLVYDVSTLRIEKSALRDQYELARHTAAEAEEVRRHVESAQLQLVKTKLLLQKLSPAARDSSTPEPLAENEAAAAELQDARDAKQRLETRIDEMDKRVLEMMVERGEFEQKINQLQASFLFVFPLLTLVVQSGNAQIVNEHTRAVAQLNDAQRQNGQLESLVDVLRSEIDRLRVEAELSRSCLEDLRNNANWRPPPAQQPPPVVVRPQPQVAAAIPQPVHLQPVQPVQPQQQQPPASAPQPQNQMVLQPANSSAFVAVERTAENAVREAAHHVNTTAVIQPVEVVLDEQQPGPSNQQPSPRPQPTDGIELVGNADEFEVLGEIARSSQQVADYLRSQSARFANDNRARPHRPPPSLDSQAAGVQTEGVVQQHADVQATDEHDARRTAALELEVQQRESEIHSLVAHRNELMQQLEDAKEALNELNARLTQSESERAQFGKHSLFHPFTPFFFAAMTVQQRSIESEEFSASVDELQMAVAKLQSERDQLSASIQQYIQRDQQMAAYIEQLKGEKESLESRMANTTAEDAAQITQLMAERDFLTQQLNQMQLRVDELRTEELPVQSSSPAFSLNVDFAQQFDRSAPLSDAHAQTEAVEEPPVRQPQEYETRMEIPLESPSAQIPPLADMSRVVSEQKAVLRACIEESMQMEVAMNSGVESLVSLNAELETCAEAIRAQVHALSQQIARELTDQRELVARLDANRDVSAEELANLRAELAETKAENERNLRRIAEVEEAHRTLSRTYEELTERYAALQAAFEDLRTLSEAKAESANASTSTHLDGETIERMLALSATIEEMSASSAEARDQLQFYRERLVHLQNLMATQLTDTHGKLEELKTDEISALRTSVVTSIGEFKTYLLRSFGQLQQALETNEPAGLLGNLDDSVRRELENTERISRALLLCERICRDIEEDSRTANEQLESSACLEAMLQRIHDHWKAKQTEVEQNARALQEQRHLSEVLEGRLNEAEHQLSILQNRQLAEGTSHEDARLTTKQADNNALFRCNSELAHANVTLHAQVEQLQSTVQKVSDELHSLSSESRHSSTTALAKSAESPTQTESEEPADVPPVSISVETALQRAEQPLAITTTVAVRGNTKAAAKATARSPTKRSPKAAVKKAEVPKPAPPPPPAETADDSWGWGDEEAPTDELPTSAPPPAVLAPPPPASSTKATSSTPKKAKQTPPAPEKEEEEWNWAAEDDEPQQQDESAADAWAWNDGEQPAEQPAEQFDEQKPPTERRTRRTTARGKIGDPFVLWVLPFSFSFIP
ncbi:hypothetical protein M3Y99_00731000 [Aphelenchoides fujianensis]|nr:hypothetical protein M3Y99_00731000 [Aphelenchoides fujianensis]